jgi:hypothetical protein
MFSRHNLLNAPCNGDRVATHGVDLYSLFQQHDLGSAMLGFEFGERLVNRACSPVDVVVANFVGDLHQYRIDESVIVRPPLAPCDYIKGNFYGAFQFRDRLARSLAPLASSDGQG